MSKWKRNYPSQREEWSEIIGGSSCNLTENIKNINKERKILQSKCQLSSLNPAARAHIKNASSSEDAAALEANIKYILMQMTLNCNAGADNGSAGPAGR